jgi:hypothetical protein
VNTSLRYPSRIGEETWQPDDPRVSRMDSEPDSYETALTRLVAHDDILNDDNSAPDLQQMLVDESALTTRLNT